MPTRRAPPTNFAGGRRVQRTEHTTRDRCSAGPRAGRRSRGPAGPAAAGSATAGRSAAPAQAAGSIVLLQQPMPQQVAPQEQAPGQAPGQDPFRAGSRAALRTVSRATATPSKGARPARRLLAGCLLGVAVALLTVRSAALLRPGYGGWPGAWPGACCCGANCWGIGCCGADFWSVCCCGAALLLGLLGPGCGAWPWPGAAACCPGWVCSVHWDPSHQRSWWGVPCGSAYQPAGMFAFVMPGTLSPGVRAAASRPAGRPGAPAGRWPG